MRRDDDNDPHNHTDRELADLEVVAALRKLKAKAEKDLYAGRTKRLDSYVAERKPGE